MILPLKEKNSLILPFERVNSLILPFAGLDSTYSQTQWHGTQDSILPFEKKNCAILLFERKSFITAPFHVLILPFKRKNSTILLFNWVTKASTLTRKRLKFTCLDDQAFTTRGAKEEVSRKHDSKIWTPWNLNGGNDQIWHDLDEDWRSV